MIANTFRFWIHLLTHICLVNAYSQECVPLYTITVNTGSIEVNDIVDMDIASMSIYSQYAPDSLTISDTSHTVTILEELPDNRLSINIAIHYLICEPIQLDQPDNMDQSLDFDSIICMDSLTYLSIGDPQQLAAIQEGIDNGTLVILNMCPQGIPTAGGWGLICLSILLVIMAVTTIANTGYLKLTE